MEEIYKHLNNDALKIIGASKEDRVNFLHNPIWIEHPQIKDILKLFNQLLTRPKKPRMQNLLLIGDSNMGKTTIIRNFEEQNKDYTLEDGTVLVKQVISAIAPTKADEKSLYMSILDAFWTPYNTTDSIAKLQHQMYCLFNECNVKMLILDEIHHFLSGTAAQQRAVMNAIKNISTKLMIPIVGVGIKDAAVILSSDPQLSSRFDIIKLKRWDIDKNFLGLLKAFEKRLPLKKPSNLIEKEKSILLHSISSGNLGDLHRLLIECATYAIETNKEEITIDIIKKFKWVKPTSKNVARELNI